MSELDALGGDLEGAMERVGVPAYVVDRDGIIRWLNPAAQEIVGDACGRHFTSVLAAEDTSAAEHFARQIAGTERVVDSPLVLLGPDGEQRHCEFSSVTLTDTGDRVVGVFGQLVRRVALDSGHEADDSPADPRLTPRQGEVLRLLDRGLSTDQIARELRLSPDTVRRHVRNILRALGAQSRLEAIGIGRSAAAAAR